MNRRHFLQTTAALLAYRASSSFALVPTVSPSFTVNPFTLGVASGDPSADGVVLWTRLAPAPSLVAGGMGLEEVPVRWEMAEDESMHHVVRTGAVAAVPELGHSVHVEVTGLMPAHTYSICSMRAARRVLWGEQRQRRA